MRYLLLLTLSLTLVACDSDATRDDVDIVGEDGSCVVSDRTFDDAVTIPRDAACTFTNVEVEGDIQLNRGASLDATDLDVEGNVQAQGASGLAVTDSRVLGDIPFEQGGSVDVHATFIDGNLQLESNDGGLNAQSNTIEGKMPPRSYRLVHAETEVTEEDASGARFGPFLVSPSEDPDYVSVAMAPEPLARLDPELLPKQELPSEPDPNAGAGGTDGGPPG